MKLDIIMWQESGFIFTARYISNNLLVKKFIGKWALSETVLKKSNVSLVEWTEFKDRVLKWKKRLDVQDVEKK